MAKPLEDLYYWVFFSIGNIFFVLAAYPVDMSLVPRFFYPFGPAEGDTMDSPADDSHSGRISLAQSLTFYGDVYDHLYVSTASLFKYSQI